MKITCLKFPLKTKVLKNNTPKMRGDASPFLITDLNPEKCILILVLLNKLSQTH